MIKAVLFDFGGVLITGGGAGSLEVAMGKILGVPASEVNMMDLDDQMRRGTMSTDDYFKTIQSRYPGSPHITNEQYLEALGEAVRAPQVYDLAAKLRDQGIVTGIFSNVFANIVEYLEANGYYDNFSPLLLSAREHFAKPDEEFYDLALVRLGLTGDEVLFIDDQPKCMPPAVKRGIHTILATSPDQIVTETKTLLAKLNGLEL